MQSLDKFLPHLLPWVIGCPTPLAHQALVRSARLFCEESNVVVRTVQVMLVEGESTYDIDLDSDTDATRILGAWLGGQPLHVPTARSAAHKTVSANSGETGQPVAVTSSYPNSVTVIPAPGKNYQQVLTVSVATRPKNTARVLDDSLFDKWLDGVVSGAIGSIAAIPGQPYSDMVQASAADARFWRSVNRARIEAQRGGVGTAMRVRNTPLV